MEHPDLLLRLMVDGVYDEDEWQQYDETVISIRFNEVVSSDSQRVNVVLTEWPDKGLNKE